MSVFWCFAVVEEVLRSFTAVGWKYLYHTKEILQWSKSLALETLFLQTVLVLIRATLCHFLYLLNNSFRIILMAQCLVVRWMVSVTAYIPSVRVQRYTAPIWRLTNSHRPGICIYTGCVALQKNCGGRQITEFSTQRFVLAAADISFRLDI